MLRRPGLLGALLFVATMGLAAALAWQAARASASHRAAAEASLIHHATIAAWRFSREGRSWIGYGMSQAGDQLLRETTQHDSLPGPELVRRVLAEKGMRLHERGIQQCVVRRAQGTAPGQMAELPVRQLVEVLVPAAATVVPAWLNEEGRAI